MKYERHPITAVGMRVFVDYYCLFKDSGISNKDVAEKLCEEFTYKSKLSRTSKARRLFRDNEHIKTLEMILNSDSKLVSEETRIKAREIYNNETH